jgi:hypothetical protein
MYRSGLENREYCRRYPLRWPRNTLYPQKLALTSPTSGGRSVGIVRLRAKGTEWYMLSLRKHGLSGNSASHLWSCNEDPVRVCTMYNEVWITYFTDRRHSSAAASCVAIHDVPNILLNPKVHYHVNKSLPLVPILNLINSGHITPPTL